MKNEVVLRAGDTINEFGWDNKHAGINVLISKVLKPNKSSFHFLIISLLLLNHCATNFIDYLNIIYCLSQSVFLFFLALCSCMECSNHFFNRCVSAK